MNDINKKTKLTNVSFDFNKDEKRKLGPHLHYTLGAASLMDEPLLLKSKNEISDEELMILKKINKPKTVEEKTMSDDVTKKLKKENEELKKQLDDLSEIKKELKKVRIEKSLSDFPFEEELLNEVSETMVVFNDETTGVIIKAFAAMRDFKEPEEDNELKKQLSDEAGSTGDADVVEKSLSDKIKEAREKETKK